MSRLRLRRAGRHRIQKGGASRLPDRIALTALLATVISVVAFAGSAISDQAAAKNVPPGNKGTAKITVDGQDLDGIPDNDPHPGCIFDLKFFFFPRASDVDYTFTLHPPTKDGSTGGSVTLDPTTEPNANVVVDLTDFLQNSGVTPQPQQGYHVKLEIETKDTRGPGDDKHKVFWVNCAASPSPTPSSSTSPSVSVSPSVSTSPSVSVSPSVSTSPSTSVSPSVSVSPTITVSESPSTSVSAVTTPRPTTSVKGVRLSGTGSKSYAMLLISSAAAFIMLGGLMVTWSKRRRRVRAGL